MYDGPAGRPGDVIDKVPRACPLVYHRPAGRPTSVTDTVSSSASLTGISNAVIVSPCSYVLAPGAVIVGGVFGGGTVMVIVNPADTTGFTPSFT